MPRKSLTTLTGPVARETLPGMPDSGQSLAPLYESEHALDLLSRRKTELPGSIVDLEAKAQAARDVISSQREALEDAEKHRREQEGALQDSEAQRDKFKGQTALVKTNAEYTALLREIDQVTDGIGRIEEEILVAMERIDELSGALEVTVREQERLAAEFDEAAAKVRDELRQVEVDLEGRAKELEQHIGDLEPKVRHLFERARQAKGSGCAMISGRVCSACHRDIPFEDINKVLGGEVIPCQSCRRLLVVDPSA